MMLQTITKICRHWLTLRGHDINWHKGSEGLRPSWSQSKKPSYTAEQPVKGWVPPKQTVNSWQELEVATQPSDSARGALWPEQT
jgi:hypothetical protein